MTVHGGRQPTSVTEDTNDESGGQLMLPLSRGTRVMRVAETSELNESTPADGTNVPVIELYDRASAPLGQRLCSARETRNWSRADVANRLKLPLKLIERLECDDYEGLSDGVFLRGYLRSYARLVGVCVEQATSVAAAHTQTAPLIATGTISRSRYLFDRYSVSATYLVLTAIIVVPAVWLATHGGLEQNLARTTPLDAPANIVSIPVREPVGNSAAPSSTDDTASGTSVATASMTTPAPSVSVDPPPVIASMTPFAATPAPAVDPAPEEVAPPANATGSGAHTLSLKLSQQSWVEITTADGRKLEYSMLAAGSEHSYRSDSQLSVRLGNAQGAQLRTDGAAIDLTPFQRGNVAHVRVFGEAGAGVSRIDQ
ncbi:MAG: RodZ domain-containing protein [Dokdonella sp.]